MGFDDTGLGEAMARSNMESAIARGEREKQALEQRVCNLEKDLERLKLELIRRKVF